MTAPHRATREEIAEVVREKARWITRHLARLQSPLRAEARYEPGDRILWGGRDVEIIFDGVQSEQLMLGFGTAAPMLALREHQLVMSGMSTLTPEARHWYLQRWAMGQAALVLPERVRHFAARLGRPVREIRITSPVRQWGACSSTGRITMNWRLMLGRPEWADYVAAHEACHLVYRHHQPTFWKLVETLVPEYRTRRKELREAGPRLVLPPPAAF